MVNKMKKQKGSIGIESFQGRLRLRLPRQLYGGRQRYLTLGLSDTPDHRKFADLKAKQIEFDLLTGQFDESFRKYKPPVLAQEGEIELAELWRKFTKFKQLTVSPSTLATDYEKTRRMIAGLKTKSIADAVGIRDVLVGSHPPNAVKRYLTQLSACCDWGIRSSLISINPFKGMAPEIKIPKSKETEIESFTERERDLIILGFQESKPYNFYANFVEFLFFTGCRPSEAIALEWQNISPDLKTVTFKQSATQSLEGVRVKSGLKTQASRKIPVNDQLKGILTRTKEKSPGVYVFPSPKGNLIDFHNFRNRAWTSILNTLKIPYRKPYATRHTFISLCLESGIDAKEVARWVGNSPEIIYKHYAGNNLNISIPEL